MAALQLCERPIVLFDFDGTVADTGRAVMTSTRKALAARGFSEAQMGDLRRMIGPPLWKSFHDFYGFSREESLVVADEYRAFFDELGPEEYPVFDGIPELLDGLVAQGKRLAVATSRMEAKCIDMVHELGLSQFEAVAGMNPLQGRETKADSVRDALAELGLTACDAVMIGRGVLGRPFFISEVNAALQNAEYQEPSYLERIDMSLDYARRLCEDESERTAMRKMRGMAAWYVSGMPQSKSIKNKLALMDTYAQMEEIMVSYKAALKELVGR